MKELYSALVNFQKDLKNPKKDTQAFKYRYSPIEVCWEAVRENMAKNGLAVIQFPIQKDNMLGVKTLLLHLSGESIESEYYVELLKKDIQSVGATLTYCRRYAFCSCLGITPENEDDDGLSAMPVKPEASKTITTTNNAQVDLIKAKLEKLQRRKE